MTAYEIANKLILSILLLIFGAIIKGLWDRWFSDSWCSKQVLLDRLQKGTIRSKGKQRLFSEAEAVLKRIKSLSFQKCVSIPNLSPFKLTTGDSLYIRPTSLMPEYSAAPSASNENHKIVFLSSESTAINDLCKEIVKTIDRLVPDNSVEQKLISALIAETNKEMLLLWLHCPNLIVRSIEEIEKAIQEIKSVLAPWFPLNVLAVEIYLADDLCKIIAGESLLIKPRISMIPLLCEDVAPSDTIRENCPAVDYVEVRRIMRVRVKEGEFIGEEPPDLHNLPKEVLIRNLTRFQIQGLGLGGEIPGDWKSCFITGPPGSGKTDLTYLITRSNIQNTVSVRFDSAQALNCIMEAANEERPSVLFRKIADAAGEMAPAEWCDSHHGISKIALADAIYHLVWIERSLTCMVVVDNLHQHVDVHSQLRKLGKRITSFPIKLLLVSRTKPEASEQFDFLIQCSLLDKESAETTLKTWLPRKDVSHVFGVGWVGMQEKFSAYVLRCIRDNLNDLESSSGILLQRTIKTHLAQMLQDLGIETTSPAEALRVIKQLVEDGEDSGAIKRIFEGLRHVDPVSLLGQLSWASRFAVSANAILTPRRLVVWSGKVLPSSEVAAEVLRRGADLEVFNLQGESAVWKNTLISDGCAALYFAECIKKGEDQDVIAEMLRQLKTKQSLDILNLVLDTSTLVEAIRCAATKPDIADKAVYLLNEQVLADLAGKPEWIDAIAEDVMRFAQKNENALASIGAVLSKLEQTSENLREFRESMMTWENTDGDIALAMFSSHESNKKFLFSQTDAKGISCVRSLRIAALTLASQDAQILSNRIYDLYTSGKVSLPEVEGIWCLWCDRQDPQELVEAAYNLPLIESCESDSYDFIMGRLISLCFRYVAWKEKRLSNQEIMEFQSLAVFYSSRGIKHLGGQMAKWVAYERSKNLIDLEGEWIVEKDNLYAIPATPYDSRAISAILRIVFQNPLFDLPKSSELTALQAEGESAELVSDNFPRNRQWWRTEGVKRHQLAIFSDGKLNSFVGQLNQKPVAWRPRYALKNDTAKPMA